MRALVAVAALGLVYGCGPAEEAKTVADAKSGAPSTGTPSCLDRANGQRPKRADEPSSVHVQHVLVKHKDAKNPRDGVTRTREEACTRAEEALAKMKESVAFDKIVADYSDEAGAATRSGSIGNVTRADVQPAFADAAFILDLNQLSDVVETDFGFHLILRVP